MFLQVTENLQQAYRRVAKAQEAVTTGKQINRLSDNPFGAVRVLRLRGFIASLEQYDNNTERLLSLLEQAEATLGNAEELLTRAKELALASANDTQGPEARAETASEVHQLYLQLLSIANSTVGDRYIFGGFKDVTAPFSESGGAVTYHGDSSVSQIQINSVSVIGSNVPGNKIFQGVGIPGGVDIFDTLTDLEAALRANDLNGVDGIQTQLSGIDKAIDQLLGSRVEYGARINHAQGAKDALSALKIQSEAQRARIEDADVLQTYSEFARYQQALEAALSSAARTLQPSLLDFLR
jgi:flagellar hook-associated protein 3 FlgL